MLKMLILAYETDGKTHCQADWDDTKQTIQKIKNLLQDGARGERTSKLLGGAGLM